MFYENQRIINKQLKFVKTKAYDIIQDLESKGLSNEEIVACIALLQKEENSETQKEILDFALKTVNARKQGANDAVQTINTSYSFLDGRIQRKSQPATVNKPIKRKT